MRSYFFHSFICALFASALTTNANAAVKFVFERSEDNIGIVAVQGDFELNDSLSPFLRIIKQHQPNVVTFHSAGGNIYKAMEVGRLIRKHGLNTLQLRDFECSSACALAFMGGVVRLAQPGSIGVHKSSFSEGHGISADDAVAAVQQTTADIIAYMQEMGVDSGVLGLALSTSANDMRYLTGLEMETFRITQKDFSKSAQPTELTSTRPAATAPNTQPRRSDRPTTSFTQPLLTDPGRQTYVPPEPTTKPRSPSPQRSAPQHAAVTPDDTMTGKHYVPLASSGLVRHPKGVVWLKISPNSKAQNIIRFGNGTRLSILETVDRWYKVRIGGRYGYMHHTWVRVDQFDSTAGLQRLIQIKSFPTYNQAASYLNRMTLRTSIYLATNGWYAVTLRESYERQKALNIARGLKAQRKIPDDSFVTLGNTYARKICCH